MSDYSICSESLFGSSFNYTLFFHGQLHTFPEGKVSQEDAPIRRLKWGTASLIVRAPVTPIVLPIIHHGLEEVIPCSSSPPPPQPNEIIVFLFAK